MVSSHLISVCFNGSWIIVKVVNEVLWLFGTGNLATAEDNWTTGEDFRCHLGRVVSMDIRVTNHGWLTVGLYVWWKINLLESEVKMTVSLHLMYGIIHSFIYLYQATWPRDNQTDSDRQADRQGNDTGVQSVAQKKTVNQHHTRRISHNDKKYDYKRKTTTHVEALNNEHKF